VTGDNPIYSVELDNFTGPLDLLLKLIEAQQLDICDISLAKVTKDYLSSMQTLELDPHQANWFLVIASKLILVKSRALLPSSRVETEASQTDEQDLSAQLRLLSYFKNLASELSKSSDQYYARKNFKKTNLASSYDNINSQAIARAFKQLTQQPKLAQQQVFKLKRSSNIALRAELIKKLQQLQTLDLCDIGAVATTKQEKISLFMIILELIKANQAELRYGRGGQKIEMAK